MLKTEPDDTSSPSRGPAAGAAGRAGNGTSWESSKTVTVVTVHPGAAAKPSAKRAAGTAPPTTKLAGGKQPISQDVFLAAISAPGAAVRPVHELFDFFRPAQRHQSTVSTVLKLTPKQHDIMYALAGCSDVTSVMSNVKPPVRAALLTLYGIERPLIMIWFKNRRRIVGRTSTSSNKKKAAQQQADGDSSDGSPSPHTSTPADHSPTLPPGVAGLAARPTIGPRRSCADGLSMQNGALPVGEPSRRAARSMPFNTPDGGPLSLMGGPMADTRWSRQSGSFGLGDIGLGNLTGLATFPNDPNWLTMPTTLGSDSGVDPYNMGPPPNSQDSSLAGTRSSAGSMLGLGVNGLKGSMLGGQMRGSNGGMALPMGSMRGASGNGAGGSMSGAHMRLGLEGGGSASGAGMGSNLSMPGMQPRDRSHLALGGGLGGSNLAGGGLGGGLAGGLGGGLGGGLRGGLGGGLGSGLGGGLGGGLGEGLGGSGLGGLGMPSFQFNMRNKGGSAPTSADLLAANAAMGLQPGFGQSMGPGVPPRGLQWASSGNDPTMQQQQQQQQTLGGGMRGLATNVGTGGMSGGMSGGMAGGMAGGLSGGMSGGMTAGMTGGMLNNGGMGDGSLGAAGLGTGGLGGGLGNGGLGTSGLGGGLGTSGLGGGLGSSGLGASGLGSLSGMGGGGLGASMASNPSWYTGRQAAMSSEHHTLAGAGARADVGFSGQVAGTGLMSGLQRGGMSQVADMAAHERSPAVVMRADTASPVPTASPPGRQSASPSAPPAGTSCGLRLTLGGVATEAGPAGQQALGAGDEGQQSMAGMAPAMMSISNDQLNLDSGRLSALLDQMDELSDKLCQMDLSKLLDPIAGPSAKMQDAGAMPSVKMKSANQLLTMADTGDAGDRPALPAEVERSAAPAAVPVRRQMPPAAVAAQQATLPAATQQRLAPAGPSSNPPGGARNTVSWPPLEEEENSTVLPLGQAPPGNSSDEGWWQLCGQTASTQGRGRDAAGLVGYFAG